MDALICPVPASLRVVMLSNGPSVQNGLRTVLNGQVVGWSFLNSAHLREFRGSIRVNKVSQSIPFARGGWFGMMTAVTTGQKELAWNPSGSGRVIAFNWGSGAALHSEHFVAAAAAESFRSCCFKMAPTTPLAYSIADEWHWWLYRSWHAIIEAAIIRNVPFKSQKTKSLQMKISLCPM